VYIAIEGPIGVGKTTLSKLLSGHLGADTLHEVVEENPFLPLFYQDPLRYGFKVQVFFLLSRYKQLLPLSQPALFSRGIVADYLFDKDAIFAAMNLSGAEWDLYNEIYSTLAPKIPAPDLTIYLRAPVEVLLGRIKRRGRSFEQDMQGEYLGRLSHFYEHHFQTYPHPLWTVEADQINYADSESDQSWMVRQVAKRIGAAGG
jgi:deoxyadenosine/deoxycytidine kinase